MRGRGPLFLIMFRKAAAVLSNSPAIVQVISLALLTGLLVVWLVNVYHDHDFTRGLFSLDMMISRGLIRVESILLS